MKRSENAFHPAHFFAHLMSTQQCISFLDEQCRSLKTNSSQAQEMVLAGRHDAYEETFAAVCGQIAAYDGTICAIERLMDVALEARHMLRKAKNQEDDASTEELLIEHMTRELRFLSRMQLFPQGSPATRQYAQQYTEIVSTVRQKLGTVLAPLLVNTVVRHLGREQVHALDVQPPDKATVRRQAVLAACEQLAQEKRLDPIYAVIARGLTAITFPRDLYSKEDRFRRGALPSHVGRLLVADLLTFIATLKAEEFAGEAAWDIALRECSSAAQHLVDRRVSEMPLPQQTMWVDFSDSLPAHYLTWTGIVARHEEQCPFCDTQCRRRRVTFPAGTIFGDATREFPDYGYSMSVKVPGVLPDGLLVFLSYNGVWCPDDPWLLSIITLHEDVIS